MTGECRDMLRYSLLRRDNNEEKGLKKRIEKKYDPSKYTMKRWDSVVQKHLGGDVKVAIPQLMYVVIVINITTVNKLKSK